MALVVVMGGAGFPYITGCGSICFRNLTKTCGLDFFAQRLYLSWLFGTITQID